MRRLVRERMVREVADWRRLGLIDPPLADALTERYAVTGQWRSGLLKWLGVFAILQLGLAVIAMVAAFYDSAGLAAILALAAAVAMGVYGVRLGADPLQRHPVSGAALVTIALAGLFGALALFVVAGGGGLNGDNVPVLLALVACVAAAVAYVYRLRWPLLLGLIMAFHALGSRHAFVGHGTYFADIQDPVSMSLIALVVIVAGLFHRAREKQAWNAWTGFGDYYITLGLIYLNLSLWFLTVPRGQPGWIALFTLAAIAQIVVGARTHDARFTGFGIVFLSIDIYTRLYERFWDDRTRGWLLLLAGLAALVFGLGCERRLKQRMRAMER